MMFAASHLYILEWWLACQGPLTSLQLSTCSQGHLFEILGQFLNLGAVMFLELFDETSVLWQHKVDSSSLSAETTSTTNSVHVVFLAHGQLVVDNESDLLDIDTTGEQVSGDQDSGRSLTELLHDEVSLRLLHVGVHASDGEVLLSHSLFEFFDSLLSVAVDQSLHDVEVSVKVDKHLNLPLLLLHRNIVLLDSLEGKVLGLDQNLGGIAHEVLG